LFSALSPRVQGLVLAVAAPLCWSVGGVVMRLVEAGAWDIVFWRAFAHLVCFGFVLRALLGHWGFATFRDHGSLALISALCVTATFVLHVIAMTETTVASALLLQSTSPIMVAVLAWLVLDEKATTASWIAIAVAMGGLAIVMGASLGDGALLGNLAALGVALASAINVILIRGRRALELRPATILAAGIAVGMALALGRPFDIPAGSAAALFALGVVQMTMGLMFFYSALKRLPAVQVVLIALLEPVLAPIWVWIAVGEVPESGTIFGGAILLAALAFNALAGSRSRAA
jgi:DME family drug/metabolite transporter